MLSSESKNKLLSSLGIGNAADFDFLFEKFGSSENRTPFQNLHVELRARIESLIDYKKVLKENKDFRSRWKALSSVLGGVNLPPSPIVGVPKESLSGLRNRVEILKKEGNGHFGKRRFEKALGSYSAALRLAGEAMEENKDLMGLVLGNRSATFFQMGNLTASLEDIEGAFYFNYPANLSDKLQDRRKRIKSRLSEEKSKSISKASLESFLDFPRHERVPQLAAYVDIIYNETLGRHGIATRDIHPGESILYERPCVFHLSSNYDTEHCGACGASLWRAKGPYPNLLNPKGAFCSWPCFKQWVNGTYAYEKNYYINALFQGQSGIPNLAYEAFLRHSMEYFRSNRESFTKVDPRAGSASGRREGPYLSEDVRNIYDLEGHHECIRDASASLDTLIQTAILLKCLERSQYFAPTGDPEDQIWAGEILHHFLWGIKYNIHSVDRIKGEMSQVKARGPIEFESIGSGLFPTLLLLNHSCAPNTVRLNLHGSSVLMVAKSFIPKGSEVSDCYGPHFLSLALTPRKAELNKRYNFDCTCPACRNGFPLLKDLPGRDLGQKEATWERFLREKAPGPGLEAISEYLSSFPGTPEPDRNQEKGGIGFSILLWRMGNGNK